MADPAGFYYLYTGTDAQILLPRKLKEKDNIKPKM